MNERLVAAFRRVKEATARLDAARAESRDAEKNLIDAHRENNDAVCDYRELIERWNPETNEIAEVKR